MGVLVKENTMKKITRKCTICGITKVITEFHKSPLNKDGRKRRCKLCDNKCAREWQRRNRDHMNALRRDSYAKDPQFRKAHYGRCIINRIIQNKNANYKFLVLCGAGNRKVLMDHLISTIPEGYTIADYGTRSYDHKLCVDHITPCIKFDLLTTEGFKACFNYKNLRLVPKLENCRKYIN